MYRVQNEWRIYYDLAICSLNRMLLKSTKEKKKTKGTMCHLNYNKNNLTVK